jgi:hypothetical protein
VNVTKEGKIVKTYNGLMIIENDYTKHEIAGPHVVKKYIAGKKWYMWGQRNGVLVRKVVQGFKTKREAVKMMNELSKAGMI